MKAIKSLILISLLALSISGCATSRVPQGVDILSVYDSAVRQGSQDAASQIKRDLRMKKAFGTVQPYVPIISFPEVRKIWIPDHVFSESDDVLVSGHWVYLKIQDSKWFIQDRVDEDVFSETVPFKSVNIDLGGTPPVQTEPKEK